MLEQPLVIVAPPSTGGGLKLKKSAADQPALIPEGASLGQALLIKSLHEQWFKPQAEELRKAVATNFGVEERAVQLHAMVNWETVEPALKERIEKAARLKLLLDLAIEIIPEEQQEHVSGNLGVAIQVDGFVPGENWGMQLAGAAVKHPPLSDFEKTTKLASAGNIITKRLNDFFARHIDEEETRRNIAMGEKRTAIFYPVDQDFAVFDWTQEELDCGYRFTNNVALTLSPEGKNIFLLYAGGEHLQDLSAGASARHPNPELRLIGVEFLLVPPQVMHTYDQGREFFDKLARLTNLSMRPDFKEELAQLFAGSAKKEESKDGEPNYAAILEERRKANGLLGLNEVRGDKVKGSATAKHALNKAIAALKGDIQADEALEQEVKTGAVRLLSSIQTAGLNPQTIERLIGMLPGHYAEKIQSIN